MSSLMSKFFVVLLCFACVGCQTTIPNLLIIEEAGTLESNPPSPAVVLIKDGKLMQAERLLRRDIKRNPKSVVARTNLGILLAKTGRIDEASTELVLVLERKPEFCPALLQQAELRLTAFDIEAAEQSYRDCLESNPDYAPALLNLGILLEIYRGQFDQARDHYERYQIVIRNPDARVTNWISDLSRRVAARTSVDQFAGVTQ